MHHHEAEHVPFGLRGELLVLLLHLLQLAALLLQVDRRIDVTVHVALGRKAADLGGRFLVRCLVVGLVCRPAKDRGRIDQIVDRHAGVGEAFDGLDSITILVASEPRGVVGQLVDHLDELLSLD